MSKPIQKGYFGGIFFEFLLQDRNADAVIILPEFPSKNSYNRMISLFFERGYHVFVPRYRGSYQSSGKFLSKNPIEDMIMFIRNLEKGKVKNLWDMKTQSFKTNKKILVGSSFSGAIALGLAAKHPVFSHIVLQAPIWDFAVHNSKGDEEDFSQIVKYVQRAYKNCYRFEVIDLIAKLKKFKEMSPNYYIPKLLNLNIPILVMHDPNDKIVAFRNTKEQIGKLNNVTLIEHYLGHDLTDSLISAHWKNFDKFIKINYLEMEKKTN